MNAEQQLTVVGEQPEIMSWLMPAVETALGERSDRWTYETFQLGGADRPDVRIELRSPTRDASIIVTASASHASGLFLQSDPVRVSVRRTSAPEPRGPLGAMLGRHPGQVDHIQGRLVDLVKAQSTPVPEAAGVPAAGTAHAGAPGPGNPSDAGFGSKPGLPGLPGLPGAGRRRRRVRKPVVALLVVVVVAALVWWVAAGGFSALVASLSPSNPPSASPSAKKTVVIKGTKPKRATACTATAKTTLTPKRSAKGNASTTCGLAEDVRHAYITKAKPGKTVSLTKAVRAKYDDAYPITCRGKKTVTCKNKAKIVVYLY